MKAWILIFDKIRSAKRFETPVNISHLPRQLIVFLSRNLNGCVSIVGLELTWLLCIQQDVTTDITVTLILSLSLSLYPTPFQRDVSWHLTAVLKCIVVTSITSNMSDKSMVLNTIQCWSQRMSEKEIFFYDGSLSLVLYVHLQQSQCVHQIVAYGRNKQNGNYRWSSHLFNTHRVHVWRDAVLCLTEKSHSGKNQREREKKQQKLCVGMHFTHLLGIFYRGVW